MTLYARPLLKSTIDYSRMTDQLMTDPLMTHGQAARKIARILRAVAQTLERSRRGRAVLAGVRAIARSFGQVLHQLWLEVTGFTFLAIAGIGALAGIREYGKYQSGHAAGPGRLVLAVCFTVSFIWFGLSSFWRVKKKLKAKALRAPSQT